MYCRSVPSTSMVSFPSVGVVVESQPALGTASSGTPSPPLPSELPPLPSLAPPLAGSPPLPVSAPPLAPSAPPLPSPAPPLLPSPSEPAPPEPPAPSAPSAGSWGVPQATAPSRAISPEAAEIRNDITSITVADGRYERARITPFVSGTSGPARKIDLGYQSSISATTGASSLAMAVCVAMVGCQSQPGLSFGVV